LNKVILEGTVYKEPQIRGFGDHRRMASFMIITKETYNDKTFKEFHKIVCFKEEVIEYIDLSVKENDMVHVEGKIKSSSYQDKKTGETKYSKDIIIKEIKVLTTCSKREDKEAKEQFQNDVEIEDDLPF